MGALVPPDDLPGVLVPEDDLPEETGAPAPASAPEGPGLIVRALEAGGKYAGIMPYLASRPEMRDFVAGLLPPSSGPLGAVANVATGGRYAEVAPKHGGLYQPPIPPVTRQEGETPSHAVIRSTLDPSQSERTLPAVMMASVPGGAKVTPESGGMVDDLTAWLRAKG